MRIIILLLMKGDEFSWGLAKRTDSTTKRPPRRGGANPARCKSKLDIARLHLPCWVVQYVMGGRGVHAALGFAFSASTASYLPPQLVLTLPGSLALSKLC